MRNNGEQGSISVFLSIILLIIIVLVGVIVDGSRVYIAENQIERAARTAACSTLANYNSQLKEEYGLFAFDASDTNKLQSDFVYFLKRNLKPMNNLPEEGILASSLNDDISSLNFMNLYDFTIEDSYFMDEQDLSHLSSEQLLEYYNQYYNSLGESGINVIHVDTSSLIQTNVLKQQILEIMKYRAPKELFEVFLSKLEIFKKSGKTVELVQKKVKVEESLSKIGEEQKTLCEIIKNINNFDKDGYKSVVRIIADSHVIDNKVTRYIDEFNNVTDRIIKLEEKIVRQKTEIEEKKDEVRYKEIEVKRTDNLISDLQNSLNKKKSSLESLQKQDKKTDDDKANIERLKSEVDKLFNELSEKLNIVETLSRELVLLQEEQEFLESDLTDSEQKREQEVSIRYSYFEIIKNAYNIMAEKLDSYSKLNKEAMDKIRELVDNSVTVQEEINNFKDDVTESRANDEIIQATGNQMEQDIESYNAKLKGEGLDINGFGDESFNYYKLEYHVRAEVDKYYNELITIIENGKSSNKEVSGLKELADEIGRPVFANYVILYLENYKLQKLDEEIRKIDSILGLQENKIFDLQLITGYENVKIKGYQSSEDLVDRYSKNIKYVEFGNDTQKDQRKKLEEEMMDSESYSAKALEQVQDVGDTKYLENKKDTGLGFWEKIWNFITGKGSEEDITTEEKFSNLPSKKNSANLDEHEAESNNPSNNDESSSADKMINSFGLISTISNEIKDSTVNLRDNLYINEYIIGTFKCAVPVKENSSDFFDKFNRKSYFETQNAEVEYILNGNLSEEANINSVKIQIFTIRTAMNVIHIFSNPMKMKAATSIGTFLSGPVPLLAPLVTTVIVFGWSSVESVLDTNMLMKGESVPFYKITDNEWKTSITGIAKGVAGNIVEETTNYIANKAENLVDNLLDTMFMKIENEIIMLIIEAQEETDEILVKVKDMVNQYTDYYTNTLPVDIQESVKEAIVNGINEKINDLQSSIDNVVGELGNKTGKALSQSSDKVREIFKGKMLEYKQDIKRALLNNPAIKSLDNIANDMVEQVNGKETFNLKFNYKDYLRILLLMRNETTKLRRIMDLIQLNIQETDEKFLLEDYYTSINVHILSSVNYMFMTKTIIPKDLRFKDGHKIEFSIIQDY